MARSAKETSSDAIFGSRGLPSSGIYFILSAVIIKESMAFAGYPDRTFNSLQLELAHDNNGQIGVQCMHRLQLNGCWRSHRGSDGIEYKSGGTMIEELLTNCGSHSFDYTCEWINNNLKGKKICLNYTRYPKCIGGFGYVMSIDFI